MSEGRYKASVWRHVMSEWEQTVEHGAASARHAADIKRDVAQALQQARREERKRILRKLDTLAFAHRVKGNFEEADTINKFSEYLCAMPEEERDE